MRQVNFFHEFHERIDFSEEVDNKNLLLDEIIKKIPNAVDYVKSKLHRDKNGTDWWIRREGNLRPLSIDIKNREFCPIERWGTDDACIETTSVYKGPNNGVWEDGKRIKIGWTLDITKETDYVVYTWPKENGLRYWILPFPFLCMAAIKNLEIWKKKYKELAAPNKNYLTLSIFPPRIEIAKAIKEIMNGIVL